MLILDVFQELLRHESQTFDDLSPAGNVLASHILHKRPLEKTVNWKQIEYLSDLSSVISDAGYEEDLTDHAIVPLESFTHVTRSPTKRTWDE